MISTFLTYYYNFTLDNPTMPLTAVLWALYAGILIATVSSVYTKSCIGRLPRALLNAGSLSKDSAKSAEDLGIKLSFGMRHALRDTGTLRKYVHIANEDQCMSEKAYSNVALIIRRFFSLSETHRKYDFSKALFYIPEEKKYTADVRYEYKGRRGGGIIAIIATAVAGAVVVIALLHFIPEILGLLDDAITLFKSIAPGN